MAVVVKGLLMDGAAFIASERVFFLQSGSLVSLDVGVLYDTVAPRKEPVVHMRAEDLSYQLFAAEPCPRDASVIACLGFNKEESDFVLILKIDLQGSAAFRVVAQHSIKGCASNVLWSPSGSYLCAVQDTDDGNCNCEAVTLFRLTLEQKQPTKSQSGTKDDQSAPQQTTKYRLTCIAEGKKSFPVFLSLNESHIDCLAMYKYQREASTIEIWDLERGCAAPQCTVPIENCHLKSMHAIEGHIVTLYDEQHVCIIPILEEAGKIRAGAPKALVAPIRLLIRDDDTDDPQWGNVGASIVILLNQSLTYCIHRETLTDSWNLDTTSLPPVNRKKQTQLLLNESAKTVTVLQWEDNNLCTATSITIHPIAHSTENVNDIGTKPDDATPGSHFKSAFGTAKPPLEEKPFGTAKLVEGSISSKSVSVFVFPRCRLLMLSSRLSLLELVPLLHRRRLWPRCPLRLPRR